MKLSKGVKGIVAILILALLSPACSDGGRNRAPVADAGVDKTVMVGQAAVLDGSGSYDPDGDTLTYTWELVQWPDGGQAALSATSGVTVELVPDVEGVWVVRLVVNDGKLDSPEDTVQVTATGGLPCQTDAQCDDQNVCTDDVCNAQNQCEHANNTADCDDGDACTMNDVCADGICGGEPLDADGDEYVSDACTGGDDCDDSDDSVNPGAFEGPVGGDKCSDGLDNDCDGYTDAADDGCIPCTQDSDCDDQDACNGQETCVNNQCLPGTALNCDDGNDCTQDSCNPADGCHNDAVADGTECGARFCSGQDWVRQVCASGACTGSEVVETCASATTCLSAETCDPTGGCLAGSPAPDGTGCDEGDGQDGEWCNSSCRNGVCTTTAADCDDGLFCNGLETCDDSSGCVAGTPLSDGSACDEGTSQDGNWCNSSCRSGVCVAGSDAICDDGEECTTDSCDPTDGCHNDAVTDGTECGSRYCSGQDWMKPTCQSGACTGSELVQTCAGPLVCSATETCDPQDGCVAGTVPPDGTPCDEGDGQDGNWCNSSCQSQVCTAGAVPTCDDGLLCNGSETCDDASGCVPGIAAADGTACDQGDGQDGNWCNSSCQSRVCTPGAAPTCDDGLLCNGSETCDDASGCVSGTAPANGTPCDEGAGDNGDLCDSSCQSGACVVTAAVCDDGLICNGTETCDPTGGCVGGTAERDGLPCDEGAGDNGDLCDSSCQSGACVVAAPVCDDGLICNGAESCNPASGCQAGTTAAAGTACDEGSGENGNHCDSSCQSGACVATTPADLGQPCEDAYECTVDLCDGTGTCMVTDDDTHCDAINAGDLCRPECFGGASGCGTPPAGMTLVCNPNPVYLITTDTSTCELNLAGVGGQVDCLSCLVTMGGLVEVEYSTFDACDAGGWTLVADPVCADTFSDCVLGVEDQPCCDDWSTICVKIGADYFLRTSRPTTCGGSEEWRIQKNYDFTGLTGVEMCLDIAGHNATVDQSIAVLADGPDNTTGGPDMFFCDSGGPRQGVNDIFYRLCAPVPDWANGSPDVTLTIIAHSGDNQLSLLLDNISIRAWNDTCTPGYLNALTADFTGCPDPLTDGWGGWTVTGTVNCAAGAFDCPDASERLSVDGNTADIQTTVDTTGLTGDVWLCFFFGDDGAGTRRSLDVQISTNGVDWTDAWNFSGDQGPDQSCGEVCVNLTDLDPAAAENPALGLRFAMYSSQDPLYLDHITVRGAEICDAAGVSELGAFGDNADGTYTFTARDTAGIPIDVDITCTWDDPPPGQEVSRSTALSFE